MRSTGEKMQEREGGRSVYTSGKRNKKAKQMPAAC